MSDNDGFEYGSPPCELEDMAEFARYDAIANKIETWFGEIPIGPKAKFIEEMLELIQAIYDEGYTNGQADGDFLLTKFQTKGK